jgi:hypothetical protein
MRMRSRVALSLSVVSALAALHGGVLAADGGPKAKGKRGHSSGLSTEELAVMLVSSNPDEVRFALESAPQAPAQQLTPLLIERIRAGLPAELLGPAIDALVAGGLVSAAELLEELARHRRPEIRSRALLGLITLRAPHADRSLVRGLSDPAPEVRTTAARGLGLLGARARLAELFRAFERHIDGAAVAIGELAEPTTVPRIADYLGRSSFIELTPLLDGVLLRRNLSDEAKLNLLDAIVKQGTGEARAYLEGLLPKLPTDSSARLRKALADATQRMSK